ncbi:MAG: hypothetical protein Q7T41_03545 [Candidatus Saccharibacteria bacterium]|nr:hypothetical protein [Candidatus Saccharibacteria bacterium]
MIGKSFVYQNVRVDGSRRVINFDYQIQTDQQTYNISEILKFPLPLPENDTIDRMLRALHIALGISYYKAFLPPVINHDYVMDIQEANFWNYIFKNGLGEFLYKNNISSSKLAKFKPQTGNIIPGDSDTTTWSETALLGIGGGKDSIVAGELLKSMKIDTSGFVLATGDNKGQTQGVANTLGFNLLAVERTIDKQILEINKVEGAFNGHIPISLIFALTGCIVAVAKGDRYVIVANEASASIPHAKHEGSDINHQWSKSLEFEKSFQVYIHKYVTTNLDYFSLIRPLTSVAVAKLFSSYPKYYEVFTSDNSVFKINANSQSSRWSNDSPKSLSSYILLAPWIDEYNLVKIFGHNFLDDNNLSELFLSLLGANENPVLDCVGTPSELRLCLSIIYSQDRFKESYLMRIAKEQNLIIQNYDLALVSALDLSNNHAIPEDIDNKLVTILEEKLKSE